MLSTAQASKELGPQSRQEIRDRAGFGFPSGGGESRERCGDGDITWAVRGPPAVAGEKPRKSAFQSTSHWHLPCQGAGHEDAPKPVRNTHRTQAPLTRRVPSRRRPQSLCARSRGLQRRGRGQFAVTGGVTAEGAASLRGAGPSTARAPLLGPPPHSRGRWRPGKSLAGCSRDFWKPPSILGFSGCAPLGRFMYIFCS